MSQRIAAAGGAFCIASNRVQRVSIRRTRGATVCTMTMHEQQLVQGYLSAVRCATVLVPGQFRFIHSSCFSLYSAFQRRVHVHHRLAKSRGR